MAVAASAENRREWRHRRQRTESGENGHRKRKMAAAAGNGRQPKKKRISAWRSWQSAAVKAGGSIGVALAAAQLAAAGWRGEKAWRISEMAAGVAGVISSAQLAWRRGAMALTGGGWRNRDQA
jgi:hypothetical protein